MLLVIPSPAGFLFTSFQTSMYIRINVFWVFFVFCFSTGVELSLRVASQALYHLSQPLFVLDIFEIACLASNYDLPDLYLLNS
jgi:hypothetical protein